HCSVPALAQGGGLGRRAGGRPLGKHHSHVGCRLPVQRRFVWRPTRQPRVRRGRRQSVRGTATKRRVEHFELLTRQGLKTLQSTEARDRRVQANLAAGVSKVRTGSRPPPLPAPTRKWLAAVDCCRHHHSPGGKWSQRQSGWTRTQPRVTPRAWASVRKLP